MQPNHGQVYYLLSVLLVEAENVRYVITLEEYMVQILAGQKVKVGVI
jgi:hypothetical protein